MKKYIICLFLTLLFLCLTANAEENDFVFKESIKFGDTIEDVKLKDELMANENNRGEYPPVSQKKLYTEYIYADTKMADKSCTLNYYFSDNYLKEIYYSFSTLFTDNTYNDLEQIYPIIKETLITKYGEPLEKNDPWHKKMGLVAKNNSVITEQPSYLKYLSHKHDAWLLKYNNYYIKIDLGLFARDQKNAWLAIDYYMFSEDENTTQTVPVTNIDDNLL